jgi:alkylation response protein AidB-like acyl-CoA dehydrogenase
MQLNENQSMIRQMARDFANAKIAPIAHDIDKHGTFPEATVREMGELGFMGLSVPEAYGGSGADITSYALVVEELSRVCGSHGLTVAAHNSLGCWPIAAFGTEEQKRKYLPAAAAGKSLLSFGLTEAGAGSDAGGTRTMAVRDGDHWVLNGSKMWITNSHYAAALIITAKTDPKATGSRGISAFIVDTDTPGFTVEKKEDKLGMRASDTAPLTLVDVRVPHANLLGQEGDGFKYFMKTLDGGRISIAAVALGLAEGALATARAYARQREQFGKAIAEFQAIEFMIADMVTQIQASRLLTYEALSPEGRRRGFRPHVGHGQAALQRDGDVRHRPRHPDPRRLRLHDGVPRRAHVPRRQAVHHRRRHERDPAAGDRALRIGPLRPTGSKSGAGRSAAREAGK